MEQYKTYKGYYIPTHTKPDHNEKGNYCSLGDIQILCNGIKCFECLFDRRNSTYFDEWLSLRENKLKRILQ